MKFYNEKFKFLRKKERYSAKDFCALMEIGKTLLWQWETGVKAPSEANVRLIAKKLAIPVSEISDLEAEHDISNLELSDLSEAWLSFADNTSLEKKLNQQEIFIQNIRAIYKDINQTSIVIKALLDNINSIFYVKDTNLKYITASKAFLENLSLKPSFQVISKTDSDFFTASEAKQNEDEDRSVLLTGTPVINKENYIPGSHKKKWGIISKIPILDSNNKTAGIMGNFIDITERKKTEELRKILEINVNFMSDGLCIAEKDSGKIIFVNKAIEKITGYPKEKFLQGGAEFWLNECIHKDYRYIADKIKSSTKPLKKKYKIIRSDGTVVWVEGAFSSDDIRGKKCGISITRIIDNNNQAI